MVAERRSGCEARGGRPAQPRTAPATSESASSRCSPEARSRTTNRSAAEPCDDHRPAGTHLGRGLELPAELARGSVGADGSRRRAGPPPPGAEPPGRRRARLSTRPAGHRRVPAGPALRRRGPCDRSRGRSRCRACRDLPGARRDRRSARPRRGPAAAPRVRRRRIRTSCACSSRVRGRAGGRCT